VLRGALQALDSTVLVQSDRTKNTIAETPSVTVIGNSLIRETICQRRSSINYVKKSLSDRKSREAFELKHNRHAKLRIFLLDHPNYF
jgi:hypothetical protein